MRKLFIVLLLLVVPSLCHALSVTAGQGYGTFRLSGAGDTTAASIMSVGVKFNKYIELKYLSLDTSIRMPVLPFRLWDVNYNTHTASNGSRTYIYYDSDVFGLSLSLPFKDLWGISAMYGYGRVRISSITATPGVNNPNAVLYYGPAHVFNSTVYFNIPVWKILLFTPSLGTMMHFLESKSGYSNAMSWYFTVSVTYLFNGEDKKE